MYTQIHAMANPQLHPLEVNPKTGEPFLRLRNRKNIIITPPRAEDVTSYIPNMNDPRVYEWLGSPPFPYTIEHAQAWYEKIKAQSDSSLAALEAARENATPILVNFSPVRVIRELQDDGSDVYIGDIGLVRVTDGKFIASPEDAHDEEKKAKHLDANNALPLGDENIIWTVGYHLTPSHHRRGIMTDVAQTFLWDWAIPRMGVRHIIASAFEGNEGSLRVFHKNGFKQTRFIENHIQTRGRWRNLHVVEWQRSNVEPPWNS